MSKDMGSAALKLVHHRPAEEAGAVASPCGLERLRDEELLALVGSGNKEAFRVLVERYEERAVYTARAVVGNLETAREVAQEAFLKVYAHRDRFDMKRKFSSWFYRILRNLAVDRVRRQSAGSPGAAAELVGDWDAGLRGPAAEASLRERRNEVHRVLTDLPAKFREVLVLRDLERLSCQEIADRVGLTAGTVRWRLHHARKLFRHRWEALHGKEEGDGEL